MKTLKILALVAVAFMVASMVAGCCACRRGGNNVPLHGTEWRMTQLGNEAVNSDTGFRMTLGEQGRVTGVGDCNRFNGTFRSSSSGGDASGTLSMGADMVSTRMMCPNQARETAFLQMLARVDGYSVDGARLMLLRAGDVLAIFEQVTQ